MSIYYARSQTRAGAKFGRKSELHPRQKYNAPTHLGAQNASHHTDDKPPRRMQGLGPEAPAQE